MEIRLARNLKGDSRGFCHIEFTSEEATEEAAKLGGTELAGRVIRIDYAEVSEKRKFFVS